MNIVFVIQKGRLEFECLIFVETLLRNTGIDPSRATAYYPVASPKWPINPEPMPLTFDFLKQRGIRTVAIDNAAFGREYPHANKIYALAAADAGPAMFLDTDVVMLRDPGDVLAGADFAMADGGTSFPVPTARHSVGGVWSALYRLFGLEPGNEIIGADGSVTRMPHAYYTAGLIAVRDPAGFAPVYLDTCERIWGSNLPELDGQPLYPFLDQIALPIAIARVGGRVRFLGDDVISFRPVPEAAIWHWHYPHRLLHDGLKAYRQKLRDVLIDPELRPIYLRRPSFRLFARKEGRELLESIRRQRPDITDEELIATLDEMSVPLR